MGNINGNENLLHSLSSQKTFGLEKAKITDLIHKLEAKASEAAEIKEIFELPPPLPEKEPVLKEVIAQPYEKVSTQPVEYNGKKLPEFGLPVDKPIPAKVIEYPELGLPPEFGLPVDKPIPVKVIEYPVEKGGPAELIDEAVPSPTDGIKPSGILIAPPPSDKHRLEILKELKAKYAKQAEDKPTTQPVFIEELELPAIVDPDETPMAAPAPQLSDPVIVDPNEVPVTAPIDPAISIKAEAPAIVDPDETPMAAPVEEKDVAMKMLLKDIWELPATKIDSNTPVREKKNQYRTFINDFVRVKNMSVEERREAILARRRERYNRFKMLEESGAISGLNRLFSLPLRSAYDF